MSIWEELGIERTDNMREIKRAYAAKLKLVHPEEHPKEFQKLHEAYRTALKITETKAEYPISDAEPVQKDIIVDETDKTSPEFDFDKEISEYNNQITESVQERTQNVINYMEELYNKKGFADKNEWVALFNSYDVQKIKEQSVFIDALYVFLKTHFVYESLASAVFDVFGNDRTLYDASVDPYEKIFSLVYEKNIAYLERNFRNAKKTKKRNMLEGVFLLLAGLCLIAAAFAFYMAYNSG